MKSRLFYFIPLAIFAVLSIYFALGLTRDPSKLDTKVLVNQPMGDFDLVPVAGRDVGLTHADVNGQVSLVNFFGSWCVACLQEHPFFMQVSERKMIPLYGVNYDERHPQNVVRWLARHGDPYQQIGVDESGKTVIDWGITGAPETFVVDKNGIIRFKYNGPITADVWQEKILPVVVELRKE